MKVLITGSRGYIGSVLAKTLVAQGHEVHGIDINGNPDGSSIYGFFTEANINDSSVAVMVKSLQIDTIFHLAASADVGESVLHPEQYYDNNIGNTATMLNNLIQVGWKGKIIFSSTAAVYQEQPRLSYETSTVNSPNPYGRSKYMCEQLLRDINKAHGISVAVFRYFNVAGSWDDTGDHIDSGHIIQRLCSAAHAGRFTLFGNNKNTPDKTCIRDYVHVRDVCDAHIHASHFLDDNPGMYTFNIGSGKGFSNMEILSAFQRFTGKSINVITGPGRPGDPDFLVASPDKFVSDTGYRYNHSSLEKIITTAWTYYCNKMEKNNGI